MSDVGWRPLYTYDLPERDALLLALADAVTWLLAESPTTNREVRMRIEGLVREVRGNARPEDRDARHPPLFQISEPH